jgi:diaminohydroxyphosphoribosylaminopyrimidine deaminase/5-amino-6-(5-phosphoribosylamino)uracil reductase
MYVSLEPCCTYGRTPPCTEALKRAGFGRIVAGVIDPSPDVNGAGLEILRAAGMQVDVADGDIAHRAKRQNCGVRKAIACGLPCVTYKYAMTLDGRVATDSGDSRWISSVESRALVHQWRAWTDAVVVGAGTLVSDDPALTVRDVQCDRQPLRVVVDASLRIGRQSALVASREAGPALVICGSHIEPARRAEVESWGIETAVVEETGSGLDPAAVGRHLVSRGVREVLLEGGPRLAGAWWAAGCIDRVAAFVCPRLVSGNENRGPLRGPGPWQMADASSLREVEITEAGGDVLVTGYTGLPF